MVLLFALRTVDFDCFGQSVIVMVYKRMPYGVLWRNLKSD